MRTFLYWGAGVVLALHGLIHLLGFASYLKLATVPTLPTRLPCSADGWTSEPQE